MTDRQTAKNKNAWQHPDAGQACPAPALGRRADTAKGREPGIVMLKIDGLSYRQFQQALAKDRLPHLKRLVRSGGYALKPFYSGIPSATPAVQGELFFGVKTSVPAIAFFDRQRQKKQTMLFPSAADTLARQLENQGRPLWQGGRSYSNIYVGGAAEARYCTQTMRLRSMRQIASSVKLFLALMGQPITFLQMLHYGLLEAGLAFTDFVRGVADGKNIFKELKFVPTRVVVSILLRELIRIRVKRDLAGGVRIIHASFLGYDEQAHRRGPASAFAHWCLKGIDDTIREIHRTAKRSGDRRYRLVVYADHGQEAVRPYESQAAKSLEETVTMAIEKADGDGKARRNGKDDVRGDALAQRARGLFGKDDRADRNPQTESASADQTRIIAMGPLGHIYFAGSHDTLKKARVASRLVKEGKIPLVMYVAGQRVMALNRRGTFDLASAAGAVLGADHAFAQATAEDLMATCRHPNAGDIVISGWTPEGPPLTFAIENGAHGGPGREETRAFVLLPKEMDPSAAFLRPSDLRDCVLGLLDAAPCGYRAPSVQSIQETTP